MTTTPQSTTLARTLIALSLVNIAISQNNETNSTAGAEDTLNEEGSELASLITHILPDTVTLPPSLAPVDESSTNTAPEIQEVATILGGGASCVFCESTDIFDPQLQFAGMSCNQWALLSVFAPPGDECTLLRAAAVEFCGCPTQVEERCQLCPNGRQGYDEEHSILMMQEVKCKDVVDLVAVDGEETCQFLDRFSYTCGCPGVVPSCSLCGQDSNGKQLQMTRPDEVLIPGDFRKPDTTCSAWDKVLSIDPEADPIQMVAQGRDGMTPCQKAMKQSEEQTGLHLPGLCGCPGVEPANICSPCSEGFELDKDNEECDRLSWVAPHVMTTTKCAVMQEAAIVVGCCVLPALEPEDESEDEPEPPQRTSPPTIAQATSSAYFSFNCSASMIVAGLMAGLMVMAI